MRWLYCRSRMSKSTDRVALAGVGGGAAIIGIEKESPGVGGGGDDAHLWGDWAIRGILSAASSQRLLHHHLYHKINSKELKVRQPYTLSPSNQFSSEH